VNREFTIFTGTANPALARTIASKLGAQVGACVVDRYPDGNVAVQLLETVRRKEVFLMQSTSPPVSDHLVELLALADACRRAGCARVTSVVPYFDQGRADKRNGRREPIMARVIADVLQVVGVDQVVVVDLHTPQIEGFFHAPVDSLPAVPILCHALAGRLPADIVVVSLVRSTLRGTEPTERPWESLGHLSRRELINVMISRARQLLVLVGNYNHFATFSQGEAEFWGQVCRAVERYGSIVPSGSLRG